jgi:hypothetical protein
METKDKNTRTFSQHLDKRYGRVLLTEPILLTSVARTATDYTFKTLQASGIELNSISFKPRELNNRFEAIDKLKQYTAPNYIIRTEGDNKIWASYLTQAVNADYDLNLIQGVTYLEDEDLYTRTLFYAKNKNPLNITFNEGVDFYSTGEAYKGLATNDELLYIGEEGNFYKYVSGMPGAGYIDTTYMSPIIYIDDVAVDNQTHQMVNMQIVQDITTKTVTKTGCHGTSSSQYVKIHTYYYYKLNFPHQNILSSEPIYFYDAFGNTVLTISPYDTKMDYGRGIYIVPGEEQNVNIESISTATYTVFYSAGLVNIDYDNIIFYVAKELIANPLQSTVTATYEYWTVMIPIQDIAAVIDGRWDSQVQVEFFAEPPSNYPLTIIDLGAIYTVQAIDVVAGFYRPDNYRKININFSFSLQFI